MGYTHGLVLLMSATTTSAFSPRAGSPVRYAISTAHHGLYSKDQSSSEDEGRIINSGFGDVSFESAVQSGWQPPRGSFAGITRRSSMSPAHGASTKGGLASGSSTALSMVGEEYAVIPDGGLSPCIIKVVGVGGGGCNAVSFHLAEHWIYERSLTDTWLNLKMAVFSPRRLYFFILDNAWHAVQTMTEITRISANRTGVGRPYA